MSLSQTAAYVIGAVVGGVVWVVCQHSEILSPIMSKFVGLVVFVIVARAVHWAFVTKR